MKKGDKKLLANANAIDEYISHLQRLYDFKKKRPIFVWVPDTNLYFEIEQVFYKLISGKYEKPIVINVVNTKNAKEIYDALSGWVERQKNVKHLTENIPELFQMICVINEKGSNISEKFLAKEVLNLTEIDELKNNAVTLDNSIALSFFYLTRKVSEQNIPEDILVGLIVYDLKSGRCLCFNIESTTHYFDTHKFNRETPLYDIAYDVFQRSIDSLLNFKSFIPFVFESRWLTPLPWFSYVVLVPIKNDQPYDNNINLSISEFFTFGKTIFPSQGNSFEFSSFSDGKEGRATCILNFNDKNQLTYILRFDQSKGERLIHTDFEMYCNGTSLKLITHKPLNLEAVWDFNHDLFVAIMATGTYDGYFKSVIENGMQGINELVKKNPAFLYPLNLAWRIDVVTAWLRNNPKGPQILRKLMRNVKLNQEEEELAKKMSENGMDLIDWDDEQEKKFDVTLLGYIILKRYQTGQIV